jgi:transcriptional regulator with XRE-family HTH domain
MTHPIPNNLRTLRQEKGIRQIDVARAIGHQSSDRISEWELGQRLPSVTSLFKLAHFFHVPPEALYHDLYYSTKNDE